jgi:hypothetical protein
LGFFEGVRTAIRLRDHWHVRARKGRDHFVWDDLPTLRNAQGVECVVIVRTIHFLAFLGNPEELRRRNAIVLDVPGPNA